MPKNQVIGQQPELSVRVVLQGEEIHCFLCFFGGSVVGLVFFMGAFKHGQKDSM